MRQLVRYKYDSRLYDGRLKSNCIYNVKKEKIQNGLVKYAIHGVEGWFDARCFELVKPWMVFAKQVPVVGKSLECYRFKFCEEEGFAGWKTEISTTDIVKSFYRCGKDTYLAFTQYEAYIVQIN